MTNPPVTRILHEYSLLDEAKQLGVLPESIVMKDAVTRLSRSTRSRSAKLAPGNVKLLAVE